MDKKIKHGTPLMKSAYAKLKGVNPSWITVLLPKLVTEDIMGKEMVLHCKENDKLFTDPHPTRGKARGIKIIKS